MEVKSSATAVWIAPAMTAPAITLTPVLTFMHRLTPIVFQIEEYLMTFEVRTSRGLKRSQPPKI